LGSSRTGHPGGGGFDELKKGPKNQSNETVEQIAENIKTLMDFGKAKTRK